MVLVQTSDFLIEVLHELRAIIGEHRLGERERERKDDVDQGGQTSGGYAEGPGTLLTRWTEVSLENRVETILARCWRATRV
jgi:hypothetical protein